MHGVGNKVKKILSLLTSLFATVATLCAQSPEDEYRHVSSYLTDEHHPRLEVDTLVFFRAVQNTEDIFAEISDYGLSFVAFARRGEPFYRHRTVLDGIAVRPEYRYMLNSLQIEKREYSGKRHSETYLGGSAGFTEYRTTFSEPLSAHSAGISVTDRGYLIGLNASASELIGHDWSLSATLSARTGQDMHVDGVFTNAIEAGIKLFKHWNYDHRLTLTAMFSPSSRGLRRASVKEAFTLAGDNLYNPSWGFQNGKMRNANVRRTNVPSFLAAYDADLTPDTSVTVAAGLDIGTVKYSSLDWFNALTPIPDNYRYLPSYYENTAIAAGVAEAWRNDDARYTQIDWDELYRQNRMAGGYAIYAVSDRVERITSAHLRASGTTHIGRYMILGYGLDLGIDRSRNYRQMRDLLGADYITDIDHFLVDDATFGNRYRNNLREPERIIGEGGRYGYDYALTERYGSVFASLDYQSNRLRVNVAAEAGDESVNRRGYFEKEIFPGSGSFGRSRTIHMSPYTVKAAFGWSFSPRHYLELYGSTAGEMPDAENLFLQTQYNNRTTDNPRLRTVAGGELNYTFLHDILKLRASLFLTAIFDDCEVSHYYDDLASEYCDMVVSEIDRMNIGAEIAALIDISRCWKASAAVTAGSYTYYSDPRVSLYADTDNRMICNRAIAHMGGCKAGNMPQIAATAEISYMNRGWGIRLSANYAGMRYVEPAAMRRTDRVSRQGSVSEEMFLTFVTQERLPDAVTVDGSLWKTFWLKKEYGSRSRIVVSLSVRNILGNKNIIYNARESVRIHRQRIGGGYRYSPFATTYLYAMPRTLRLSVSYRF